MGEKGVQGERGQKGEKGEEGIRGYWLKTVILSIFIIIILFLN